MSNWYDFENEAPSKNPNKTYQSIDVFVCNNETGYISIAHYVYNDRQWFETQSGECCGKISHWHRLPEVPLCTISMKSLS